MSDVSAKLKFLKRNHRILPYYLNFILKVHCLIELLMSKRTIIFKLFFVISYKLFYLCRPNLKILKINR